MLKQLRQMVNLLYENSCLICNTSSKESLVCSTCENDFTERQENYAKSLQGITVFSWGMYDDKLRQGILQLKNGKKKLASYFSNILLNFWIKKLNQINHIKYLVIPVPSHKKRIRERGYCQSSLIASDFANYMGLDFSNKFVVRTKETLFMNSLSDISERIENVKNAFQATNEISKEKNILIIDDILTSGSTMCELARTIHKKYPEVNLVGLTVASGDTYN